MKNIEILRITPLRGPNVWTYRPTLEALVDIGELEDFPSNTLPGFYERLESWLPSLIEHKCSIGERGGFLQRVREGTWPAHIVEHVTLELQTLCGQRTSFGKARETSRRGVYKIAVRSRQFEVTRACFEAARDLVVAAINDLPFDVPATVARLRSFADSLCLGPSTASIVDAASERNIPSIRLNDGNLVQLGYGAASRRIWTAETDATSAIAESIASDKDMTKRLLQACGVPIPEGREVDSAADAWDAAQDIGMPVVVKPTDANHGRGVFTDLNTQAEVEKAYVAAREEGSGVMVERFVRGNAHRLLVVGGRLVAATRGKTLSVVGDGNATILELIDSQINSDPRCGEEEEFPLEPLVLNEEPIALLELERQGLQPDSIPDADREVLIKRQGDLAYDVTDDVHPSVAAAGALAARIVGLDIAGIDLVCEDVSRPLEEQGGAIVEVNAGPSLLMHLKPAEGKPRPVGEAIAAHLFPADASGRIPIVGISGSADMTETAQLLTWLLHLDGKRAGLACRDGLFVDQRRVQKGDCAHWSAGHRLLLNRAVDAAVFESGARAILAEGLPYDRCQVGIVTGMAAPEGLEEFDIRDRDQLRNVLRTQVDVVLPTGAAVLNAADEAVAGMAELCDGEVILFAADPALPTVAAHLAAGRRAVLIRDGSLVLASGAAATPLLEVTHLPPGLPLTSVLAAAGGAWALGIATDIIGTGIQAFDSARAGLPS